LPVDQCVGLRVLLSGDVEQPSTSGSSSSRPAPDRAALAGLASIDAVLAVMRHDELAVPRTTVSRRRAGGPGPSPGADHGLVTRDVVGRRADEVAALRATLPWSVSRRAPFRQGPGFAARASVHEQLEGGRAGLLGALLTFRRTGH